MGGGARFVVGGFLIWSDLACGGAAVEGGGAESAAAAILHKRNGKSEIGNEEASKHIYIYTHTQRGDFLNF